MGSDQSDADSDQNRSGDEPAMPGMSTPAKPRAVSRRQRCRPGELAGVTHAQGPLDQDWCHYGFATTAAARAATKPVWVRSRIRVTSYSAISANIPSTSAPCAVVVPTEPLHSAYTLTDYTLTPPARRVMTMSMRTVTSEAVNAPDEQGVPLHRSTNQAFQCGR